MQGKKGLIKQGITKTQKKLLSKVCFTALIVFFAYKKT